MLTQALKNTPTRTQRKNIEGKCKELLVSYYKELADLYRIEAITSLDQAQAIVGAADQEVLSSKVFKGLVPNAFAEVGKGNLFSERWKLHQGAIKLCRQIDPKQVNVKFLETIL